MLDFHYCLDNSDEGPRFIESSFSHAWVSEVLHLGLRDRISVWNRDWYIELFYSRYSGTHDPSSIEWIFTKCRAQNDKGPCGRAYDTSSRGHGVIPTGSTCDIPTPWCIPDTCLLCDAWRKTRTSRKNFNFLVDFFQIIWNDDELRSWQIYT